MSNSKLWGRKKAAKDLRKKLFQKIFRKVEPGEVLLINDREKRNGYYHYVPKGLVGTVIQEKHRGRFYRRNCEFITFGELENDE